MSVRHPVIGHAASDDPDRMIGLWDLVSAIRLQGRHIVAVTVVVAMAVYVTTTFMTPTYTARSTLLPPRQQQAATALSSLGVLAGAVGSVVAHTGEQYVSFLRSRSISDRIVARFKLAEDDTAAAHDLARRLLEQSVRVEVNRKDGLLIIEASSRDPQRAADIANAYVEELRRLTHVLFQTAVAERRATVERELAAAATRLRDAEATLQRSGFNASDLKTDGRATGDSYRELQDRLTQAQVRLQGRGVSLSDRSIEVQQLRAEVEALRAQLARASGPGQARKSASAGYSDLQRDYRRREQSYADLVRQAELLRLEEARGAPSLPVLDKAVAPQRAVAPRRVRATVLAGAAAAVLALLISVLRTFWLTRPDASGPAAARS